MLRDVQQVDDPKRFASLLAMISQLSAAVVAAPSGHLSDRYGRKPLVYASCVLMAAVYIGFALVPPLDLVLWLGVGCARHAHRFPRTRCTARAAPHAAHAHE